MLPALPQLRGVNMPSYSKEQVWRILAGLAAGKSPNHCPMSDTEFVSRYDPPAYEHQQVIGVLNEIKDILTRLETPPRIERPYQPAKPVSNARPTGPVQI